MLSFALPKSPPGLAARPLLAITISSRLMMYADLNGCWDSAGMGVAGDNTNIEDKAGFGVEIHPTSPGHIFAHGKTWWG